MRARNVCRVSMLVPIPHKNQDPPVCTKASNLKAVFYMCSSESLGSPSMQVLQPCVLKPNRSSQISELTSDTLKLKSYLQQVHKSIFSDVSRMAWSSSLDRQANHCDAALQPAAT